MPETDCVFVMKLIYLAHPVAGDVPGNIARAKDWYRWCNSLDLDIAVIAPWIHGIELLLEDDADPVVRSRALERCVCAVRKCDELWLVGPRISTGMQLESDAARNAGVRVRDFTWMRTAEDEVDMAYAIRLEWKAR